MTAGENVRSVTRHRIRLDRQMSAMGGEHAQKGRR
jgi:hypothetical protein